MITYTPGVSPPESLPDGEDHTPETHSDLNELYSILAALDSRETALWICLDAACNSLQHPAIEYDHDTAYWARLNAPERVRHYRKELLDLEIDRAHVLQQLSAILGEEVTV